MASLTAFLALTLLATPPDDAGPSATETDGGASLMKEATHEAYSQPPSLGASALCDELRRGAQSRKAERSHLDEQRRELEAERARLEKLSAEIEASRLALRTETARLEVALQKSPAAQVPGPPSSPDSRVADARSPHVLDKARVDSLAKAVKGMKPEQAAAVLARLDPALGAELLRHLRPGDAGAVLDHLKPEQAADLMSAMARSGEKP